MARICSTCKVREAKKDRHRCDVCLHPVGTCPLCREVKTLIDSHLLPRMLYDLLNNSALYIGETGTGKIRQISKFLFCAGCDNKLNRNGENWSLHYCYRGDRRKWRGPNYRFRLREEVLKNAVPTIRTQVKIWDDGEPELLEVYSATAYPKIRWEVLAYFAISVFWRATVTEWEFEGVKDGKYWLPMSSDPESSRMYQEQMHRYLFTANADDFPTDMTLRVFVNAEEHPTLMTNLPGIEEENGTATLTLQVPGIGFELRVGDKQYGTCIVRGQGHPTFKSNVMDQYSKRRSRLLYDSLPASEQAKLIANADAFKAKMRAEAYDTSDVTEIKLEPKSN
jgi:hypothetical protein